MIDRPTLLAIPRTPAFFIKGGVAYTRQSRTELLGVTEQELTGIAPSTEPCALLFARKIRGELATAWSIGETGIVDPTGGRITVETGKADRLDNVGAFSIAALDLLEKAFG